MAAPAEVALSIDGRRVRAAAGATVLEAARAAGIPIPTLCHHAALPPAGACRLCLVEVRGAEGGGEWRVVISCMYLVEDGLRVRTDTERVRAARREILDLLLARCPDAPLIRRLAREHGLGETSHARSASPTDCLLCGRCVRACQQLGFSAISLVSRGIAREVAPPFRQPPPDCVGCLACAAVCPTGHIRYTTEARTRTIWGRSFALLACPSCGAAHLTRAQAEAWAARTGLLREELETCEACKRAATAAAMRRLAAGVREGP